MALASFIGDFLAEAEASGLRRRLRQVTPISARECEIDGRRLLNFSSNNYLGLADHPKLKERSAEWTLRYGVGATASRLVCGSYAPFAAVEEKIAAWKGGESALVFGSGYAANLGMIAALADRKTTILADKLNHASLNAGCQLSRGDFVRYEHRLIEAAAARAADTAGRKILVSDTVFSMDGDVADIAALTAAAKRLDALLYLDDAHATGFFGERGGGLAVPADDRVCMGTFSKALGGYGAYAVCPTAVKDYLVNKCASFIYTTAPPPGVFGAIDAAIDIVDSEEGRELRGCLADKAASFVRELRGLGFDTGDTGTPIVPVILGGADKALALSEHLLANGILAVAIRPPTVPRGTARIRFTLNAAHTDADIAILLELMAKTRMRTAPNT